MNYKKRTCQAAAFVLAAGMLAAVPAVKSEAAVITSNATDKIAVVFHESTAYSAGDYVIYDGEMYICTNDIQGSWSQAETSFMQITKNKELGQAEDLSAVYEESRDPSEEKSIMAFAANVWQKLRGFLGIDNKNADTDASHYKNASVSAKLNYLEQQNQSHDQNLANLQDSVTKSFQSVSNGKSLVAGAITDKGGTASPLDTFQQLSQSIRDMAQAQYDTGYGNGNKDGYDTGYSKGNKDGYDSGYSSGNKEGYDAGVAFADNRVNKDSESYKQGASEAEPKTWTMEVILNYNGPDGFHEYFSSGPGISENHKAWSFSKDFGQNTILGIVAEESFSSIYGGSYYKDVIVKTGNEYERLTYGDENRLNYSQHYIGLRDFNYNVLYPDSYSRVKITVIYI